MAAPLDGLGLVSAFVDWTLLPDLLALGSGASPPASWANLIREVGPTKSHMTDLDIDEEELHDYLAADAWQLSRRLRLLHARPEYGPTPAGANIAMRAGAFTGRPSDEELRDLGDALGAQVSQHYRAHRSVRVVERLYRAVDHVAALQEPLRRLAPGLLMAELQFLLGALARGRLPWATILELLERCRRRAVNGLGMPSGRRLRDMGDFADAVTAFHWQLAEEMSEPLMTDTEGQANAMLLTFTGLLGLRNLEGAAQVLSLPVEATPPPAPTLSDGAILIGPKEASEWIPPLEVEEAIMLLYQIAEDDFRTDDRIFERLGIDLSARARGGNPLPLTDKTKDRKLHHSRWMNRALGMELLTTSALSAVDRPDWVRSYCLTRNGHPNYHAQGGNFDVLSSYPASGRTPAFAVGVEASARNYLYLTIDEYKKQLTEGVLHARTRLEEEGNQFSKIYVLVANVRDICTEDEVWTAYKEVVAETGIASDPRIELIPMFTKDLAFAADRINYAYWDAPDQFGPEELARVLDAHVALLEQDEAPDGPMWVRDIWQQAEDPRRFGGVLAPDAPEPPAPSSSGDPSPS